MTIDFERNAGGYENVDAEDAHNTNWQEDASATMGECECEDCTVDVVDRSGDSVPDGESFPGMQCADGGVPFHRPYQSESEMAEDVDDDAEDDGQPSEYDEWQDYMGGDEYYDHSDNSMW